MSNFDPILSSEPLIDPGLSLLKDQIKNTMIPLLIKVFQLRLEIQQTQTPPSRLEPTRTKAVLPDLIKQLELLDEDLKLLQIWNQSCRTQIEKVLLEAKNEAPPSLHSSIQAKQQANPAVQKSFQEALLCKQKSKSNSTSVHIVSSRSSPFQALLKKLTLLYRNTIS